MVFSLSLSLSLLIGRPSGAWRRSSAGWGRIDADIIAQIGEGSVEARSTCMLETVLAWHHTGVADHPEAATAAVEKD